MRDITITITFIIKLTNSYSPATLEYSEGVEAHLTFDVGLQVTSKMQ